MLTGIKQGSEFLPLVGFLFLNETRGAVAGESVAGLGTTSPASISLYSPQLQLGNEAAGRYLKASELFAPKLEELLSAWECVWNGMHNAQCSALVLFKRQPSRTWIIVGEYPVGKSWLGAWICQPEERNLHRKGFFWLHLQDSS